MSKQEPPRPSDTGHADYQATDFLDTLPMLQDEIESSPAPARPVTRGPIERAMARHESASVALSATIGANRDVVPQRPRASSPPASPARLRIDSNAKAGAAHKGGPRPAPQPSPARDARSVTPPIAASTKAHDARRLREDWAVNGSKTHVATFSPSRPGSDDSTLSSTWVAETRQPSLRASSGRGTRRGAGVASRRHTSLAIAVGTVATALFGALLYIARPGAQTPATGQSAAASQPRPEAVAPAPHADAAAVAEADPDGDAAGPSTMAPDARMAGVRRTSAVPSRKKDMREPDRQTAAEPTAQLRPPARGAAPSNSVASAVEAAQAKADAFLQDDAQEPPEQKPAKSSTSALPRDPGRP